LNLGYHGVAGRRFFLYGNEKAFERSWEGGSGTLRSAEEVVSLASATFVGKEKRIRMRVGEKKRVRGRKERTSREI